MGAAAARWLGLSIGTQSLKILRDGWSRGQAPQGECNLKSDRAGTPKNGLARLEEGTGAARCMDSRNFNRAGEPQKLHGSIERGQKHRKVNRSSLWQRRGALKLCDAAKEKARAPQGERAFDFS